MASTIDRHQPSPVGPQHPVFDIEDRGSIRDLSDLAAMAKHFSLTYKGRLRNYWVRRSGTIRKSKMLGGKINSYLFLRESTDLSNAAIKAKHAASPGTERPAREHLTFFELELVQLTEDTLKDLV